MSSVGELCEILAILVSINTHNTLFFRCGHGSIVTVIIVAHVAVILHLDYNLHLGNHGIVGVCGNTGVDTVSLTR